MFAVIQLPNFSLQALLRDEAGLGERPMAITKDEIIFQANGAATGFGVRPGLTASQAQARCAHLWIKARSPAREAAATEILLQVGYYFSARIESTDVGVCTLELKGLGLERPETCQAWADRILKMLGTFRLEGQVGFGVTPALARLAAQVANPILVVQNVHEFIERLPVEMLTPSMEMMRILRLWGIETVGALIALGKDCVLERLGEEAAELFDSVSIQATRPLRQVIPIEIFSETTTFENEIETLEPLLNILSGFIRLLMERLTAVHWVAGELELELGLDSGQKIQRCFKMPAPTHDEKILLRTLRTYLETLTTNSPVTLLSLAVTPDRLRSHQFGLFETTLRNPNQFFETCARLEAMGGVGSVGSPRSEPTYKPDTFRMGSPAFDATEDSPDSAIQNNPTPLRRFRPRISAVIEGDGERPVAIRSRVLSGQIAKSVGPYLSSGAWWDDHRWSREEWDVQTVHGICCRIYRSNEGDFIEGLYD